MNGRFLSRPTVPGSRVLGHWQAHLPKRVCKQAAILLYGACGVVLVQIGRTPAAAGAAFHRPSRYPASWRGRSRLWLVSISRPKTTCCDYTKQLAIRRRGCLN